MTRPKVAPEERQRTAQACESCKRRKQKCNGQVPCNTCEKRRFECTYLPRDAALSPPHDRPPKRSRLSDDNHPNIHSLQSPNLHNNGHHSMKSDPMLRPPPQLPPASLPPKLYSGFGQQPLHHAPQRIGPGVSTAALFSRRPGEELNMFNKQPPTDALSEAEIAQRAARSLQLFSLPNLTRNADIKDRTKSFLSIVTGLSGHEGEAPVYGQTRMLQDSTKRFLYVGDAATLCFLQLLRSFVEDLSGNNTFTHDPRRNMITEGQFSLDPNTKINTQLPDHRAATVLANSFFINTHGLINIFHKDRFMTALDQSYDDPLSLEPAWLCHLNLVFAVGLMLANPSLGSEDSHIVSRLKEQHKDLDEQFYINARSMNDSLNGFEDADFWSTQALLLMTVYMLTKSKRNTAYALLGMAVRSAYALGLHDEDTMIIFSSTEQESRRNLWKSLFVMDRYLSLSLGRPSAIFDDELYAFTSRGSVNGSRNNSYAEPPASEQSSTHGIEPVVKICSIVGKILKDVYRQRKTTARQAVDFSNQLRAIALPPSQTTSLAPHQSIATLHCHIFLTHTVILSTRPFFIYELFNKVKRRTNLSKGKDSSAKQGAPLTNYQLSKACVSASVHLVCHVQQAFKTGNLSRRNPWVIYFLASAGLVLLSNEMIALHLHALAEQCIRDTMLIMEYCGEEDPQAERFHFILNTLKDVVDSEEPKRKEKYNILPPPSKHQPMDSIIGPIGGVSQGSGMHDPAMTTSFNQPYYSPMSSAPQSAILGPNPSSSPTGPPYGSHPARSKSSSSTPITMEPLPPPSAPPNPLSPASQQQRATMQAPLDPTNPNPNLPYANLFEFPAFPDNPANNMFGPSSTEDPDNITDEQIDFDAFWSWPSNLPQNGAENEGVAGLMPPPMSQSQIHMYGMPAG